MVEKRKMHLKKTVDSTAPDDGHVATLELPSDEEPQLTVKPSHETNYASSTHSSNDKQECSDDNNKNTYTKKLKK